MTAKLHNFIGNVAYLEEKLLNLQRNFKNIDKNCKNNHVKVAKLLLCADVQHLFWGLSRQDAV
jgi:hypothetical protein